MDASVLNQWLVDGQLTVVFQMVVLTLGEDTGLPHCLWNRIKKTSKSFFLGVYLIPRHGGNTPPTQLLISIQRS